MYQFILIIHVVAAVCIIALVLVQQGKGATMGAAFGSGASQTVFGSRGSGSFLLKVTIGFAVLFFTTSLTLNRMATNATKQPTQIKFSPLPIPVQSELPQTPAFAPNDVSTIPGVPGTSKTPETAPNDIPGVPPVSASP